MGLGPEAGLVPKRDRVAGDEVRSAQMDRNSAGEHQRHTSGVDVRSLSALLPFLSRLGD